MSTPVGLKQTSLNSVHRRLGARMVDFAGWDMPVQYSSLVEEHKAVRNAVGLFDVSHMGEIEMEPSEAPRIWDDLMNAGEEFGIKPCGLGARNTLRLEAKMALYGHEITASITPWEADLAWIVKLDKGTEFLGSKALEKQRAEGVKRKLVGF